VLVLTVFVSEPLFTGITSSTHWAPADSKE
jgi:hypothetical protein